MSVNLFGSADYPSVTVEIGVVSSFSDAALFNAALFDTGTFGPDVVWTDISADVREVSTNWQRSRELNRQPSATCTVVLSNADGDYSPSNTGSPFYIAGGTQLRPRVPLRVTATWAGTEYPVFTGVTTAWRESFPAMGADAVVTLNASDMLATLASIDLATATSAGAGDTVAQRLTRILNAAAWTGATSFATGTATMQATTLGANAATLCQLTADSDGGLLFADRDGALTYFGRTVSDRTRSTTVQATFSAAGIGFADPEIEFDDDTLINVARLTRVGGAAQTARDEGSVALYGEATYERSDLICTADADALAIAHLIVTARSGCEQRVVGLTTFPVRDTSTWPTLLALGIRDRCSVAVPVPWGTLTRDVFVSGISHSITLGGGWRIRFGFEDAEPFIGTGSFDSSVFDTGTFWL